MFCLARTFPHKALKLLKWGPPLKHMVSCYCLVLGTNLEDGWSTYQMKRETNVGVLISG